MALYARESFLPVLFLLNKFRQNRRDDLIFYQMLGFIAGDELELVALPGILGTLV